MTSISSYYDEKRWDEIMCVYFQNFSSSSHVKLQCIYYFLFSSDESILPCRVYEFFSYYTGNSQRVIARTQQAS